MCAHNSAWGEGRGVLGSVGEGREKIWLPVACTWSKMEIKGD